MNTTCLYHANCIDGLAAAWVVWSVYGENAEYIAMQYGDEVPDVTGKEVIMVDFSFKRKVMDKIITEAESVLVIDHHQSAQKELDGLDNCIFDMNKSGAVLSWEHFYPNRPLPKLFEYIQDRDLWQWQLPSSKSVSAAIRLHNVTTIADFDQLMKCDVAHLVDEGEIVLRYQTNEVRRAVAYGNIVEIAGYKVPCINATHLISEIGNELAKGYPFAAAYFDTDDKRVFSLRSDENGIDVSQIAEQFGGGGHKHAAGFNVSKPDLGIETGDEWGTMAGLDANIRDKLAKSGMDETESLRTSWRITNMIVDSGIAVKRFVETIKVY